MSMRGGHLWAGTLTCVVCGHTGFESRELWLLSVEPHLIPAVVAFTFLSSNQTNTLESRLLRKAPPSSSHIDSFLPLCSGFSPCRPCRRWDPRAARRCPSHRPPSRNQCFMFKSVWGKHLLCFMYSLYQALIKMKFIMSTQCKFELLTTYSHV